MRVPDRMTNSGVRKGCVRLLSIILPSLITRNEQRVWGLVLRPVLVVRSDMEFGLPSPLKDCPRGAVTHEDASAKQNDPLSDDTAASALLLSAENSDNRSDNISRIVFMESKVTKKKRLVRSGLLGYGELQVRKDGGFILC